MNEEAKKPDPPVRDGDPVPAQEDVSPNSAKDATVRREIDRLARQAGRIQAELKNLKALV